MTEGNGQLPYEGFAATSRSTTQRRGRGQGNRVQHIVGASQGAFHGRNNRASLQQTPMGHEAVQVGHNEGSHNSMWQDSIGNSHTTQSNASGQSERTTEDQILYPQMPGASWMAGLQARGNISNSGGRPLQGSIASASNSQTSGGFGSSQHVSNFQRILPNPQPSELRIPSYGLGSPFPRGATILTDEIASRSIGPSSYQHRQTIQRHRATLARPDPSSPRHVVRRQRKCTRQVWIPLSWTDALPVSAQGHECKMKKITHFIIPALKIELPSNTPWGGVYDGSVFLPGTGQIEIAHRCAKFNYEIAAEWQNLSGCFVLKTPKSHMRTEERYMGGGSLKPMYLHAMSTWKDLPSNFVYIPNPSTMMTSAQLQIYKKEVSLCETPQGKESPEVEEVITIEESEESNEAKDQDKKCDEEKDLDSDAKEEGTTSYSNDDDCGHEDMEPFQESNQEENIEATQVTTRSQTQARQREDGFRWQPSTSQVGQPHRVSSFSDRFLSDFDHGSDTYRTREQSAQRREDALGDIPSFSYGSLGEQNALVTYLLTEKWMEADRVFISLCELEVSHGGMSKNLPLDLVVDLGDLASHFWECFEACCLEDSDSAREVKDDLVFLQRRQQQGLGLTKAMVEQNVCRVLSSVSSLKPYLRFDVESYFNKAAMPDWNLWEKLAMLINDGILDMQSVIEDENWALHLLAKAPASFAKEEFTESQMHIMRKTYLEWKASETKEGASSSTKTASNDLQLKLSEAYKNAQQAFDELTVHQISFTGLLEFRRFHSIQIPYRLRVEEGKELQAVQEMFIEVLRSKKIFPDFVVEYSSITSDGSLLHENMAIDAGGLTNRCLGELWSYFFDGSWEYRTAFERPRDADICHLNSQFRDTVQARRDVQLAGQILFLMVLKKQRVTRPMTMATIAIALGQEPTRESIYEALLKGSNNLYVEDYKSIKPIEFKLMTNFMVAKRNSRKDDLEYISVIMPDYYIWFSKLSPDMEEDEFCTKVRKLMADVIFDTLFVKCSVVSKVFKEGFISLVNTVNTSLSVGEMDKKLVMNNLFKGVSVESMTSFFSAERGITAKEFLSKVIYSDNFPSDLRGIFIDAVNLFTRLETYRLYNFITDEKYNRGTPCTLICNREMSPDSLPEAHTCTKSLEVPHYKDMETLRAKLALASFSLAYGRV